MIYFNNYRVRKYLIENGFVFTVRENSIVQGKHDLVFHCKNRGRIKFGIGSNKYIHTLRKNITKEELKEYVDYSGFSTVPNWIYAILIINGWKTIKVNLKLYRIELKSYNEKWRGLLL